MVTHGDPAAGGPLRETGHTGTCSQPGCGRPYLAVGLCSTHYARRRAHGDPCYQPEHAKNLACSVRACPQLQIAKGYCSRHYQVAARHGRPETRLIAEAGSGTINRDGYRIIYRPGFPGAQKNGRIYEHRYVMSLKLGRPLAPGETVHHINGDRGDNRPENLELWVTMQPRGQRVEDLVAWAQEVLDRYADMEGLAARR